jgi:hypothetical protein
MLFLALFILCFVITIAFVYRESLARKRLRDIEEIKQKLRFFEPEHRPGCTNAAADVKFILRCCRAWKLKLQDFGIKNEDELVRKALDASARAEEYFKTPGFREEARKVLATYTLKHI